MSQQGQDFVLGVNLLINFVFFSCLLLFKSTGRTSLNLYSQRRSHELGEAPTSQRDIHDRNGK